MKSKTTSTIDLVISEIKLSTFGNFYEAKCAEITEHDLLGILVYAKFTKEKEVGFSFTVSSDRIHQKETKSGRKVNILL